MNNGINVNSEIGKLKTVLLHRPGAEVENITPDTMNQLLFDDIPFLKIAQKEHDFFAQTLRDNGAETLYIEQLATEVLDKDRAVRDEFLTRILTEAGYRHGRTFDELQEYLGSMSTKDMVDKIYAGVRKNELDIKRTILSDMAGSDAENLFYLNPLPNAYFTRDPQASMGVGMTINRMTFPARQPESLITEFIMKHHPRFKDTPIWRDRNHTTRIEGGDELILSKNVVAIGVSERTSSKTIQQLAKELFKNPLSTFDTVLAVEIPHNHAMMHLDTVFTMINHDQFTVFPGIFHGDGSINTFILTPGKNEEEVEIEHLTDLEKALKKVLKLTELDLIECGGGDAIIAPREQWNDGSNTLAISPGEIVTYDRNYVTIGLLKEHGIKVHEILSSELARGRGGARCMSQPLWREDL
ncbi:arginine deiminase [Lactococcus protaetiae]|uniref:Arginine deiminase n=1 Tax=Lactococcus protaetiae TaxID=2592653 RepID=A0A514Z643_9LACT|nr:arginine deiminase [Lactococcus protaetiae]MCL2112993.1 arginine deiminase [Streptococcaceae bacterium]QDK69967.1 arginine deiminase [Lactococcus protaetiae]